MSSGSGDMSVSTTPLAVANVCAISTLLSTTGQPQLAAAGATLQKSGEIAVVGGRTAVAAGRAQKKLVKGKNQAALQKLGHAGRNAMAIATLAR